MEDEELPKTLLELELEVLKNDIDQSMKSLTSLGFDKVVCSNNIRLRIE